MPLFDQILGAINNPNQMASTDQLGAIVNAAQQFASGQGVNPAVMPDVMSTVGGYVRSALQDQRAAGGQAQVESILNQFAGTQPNAGAVQALFSPQQQQQLAQTLSQKTGMDPGMVQMLLAAAVPLALNLLRSGTPTSQAQVPGATTGGNSVLNTFLDSDGDGDVDLGDTLSMAGRFLNQR